MRRFIEMPVVVIEHVRLNSFIRTADGIKAEESVPIDFRGDIISFDQSTLILDNEIVYHVEHE